MDITCLKCGAANRNTSHFCAKCGEKLPRAKKATLHKGQLNMPCLHRVHERAVKETGGLDPAKVAEAEAARAGEPSQPQPSSEEAPQAQAQPQNGKREIRQSGRLMCESSPT